jgi:hypothetical protein
MMSQQKFEILLKIAQIDYFFKNFSCMRGTHDYNPSYSGGGDQENHG